ncbi:hypothetical protein HN385_03925 [archaeon]|jgi:hypothetical protein|nr:hypothetical protein [archaeon]MBT3450897.1 hypothetical protein [archaeon]MBT6869079.1 hypothetical protein [archaeon]MBT7193322.1 hypothetical protein [archaeon]MBT7380330.1 hypothetical protein [archaeon]
MDKIPKILLCTISPLIVGTVAYFYHNSKLEKEFEKGYQDGFNSGYEQGKNEEPTQNECNNLYDQQLEQFLENCKDIPFQDKFNNQFTNPNELDLSLICSKDAGFKSLVYQFVNGDQGMIYSRINFLGEREYQIEKGNLSQLIEDHEYNSFGIKPILVISNYENNEP